MNRPVYMFDPNNRVYLTLAACLFFLVVSCKQSNSSEQLNRPKWETIAVPGGLGLITDDSVLAARFDWAARQALAYVHDGNDPVGKWYEAALPNREAFCMRDVSHQSQGAHYLGLKVHTKNMLMKFAENISESRDWCSYWEINRYNQPAPVDYKNDHEFWYNLPANFDVLIACYQQYLLTGDPDYLEHPSFVNFYQRTMKDYILKWELDIASVLTRDRFMNLESPIDSLNSFQVCRGLPSYGEGAPLELYLGADLFCLQYQAYHAFEKILRSTGSFAKADSVRLIADDLKIWYNTHWWDLQTDKPYSALLMDKSYRQNPSRYQVQSGIMEGTGRVPKVLLALLNMDDINIESQSYFPALFYHFDENSKAMKQLMDLSHPQKKRKEYPEVSYAWVEALVEGLMGLEAATDTRSIKTISRLPESTGWARLNALPLFEGRVSLMHNKNTSTSIKSEMSEDIQWVATFYGHYDTLWTDQGGIRANLDQTISGKAISWVQLPIAPEITATVSTIKISKN